MIYEDEEKKQFSPFDLGDRLFSDNHNTRNTQILHKELVGLNVLFTLGKLQDKYREDYLGEKEMCTLSKLINTNLQMRASILGWRSNQVVEMLKTQPTPIIQPQSNNMIDNGSVTTKRGIFGLKK